MNRNLLLAWGIQINKELIGSNVEELVIKVQYKEVQFKIGKFQEAVEILRGKLAPFGITVNLDCQPTCYYINLRKDKCLYNAQNAQFLINANI